MDSNSYPFGEYTLSVVTAELGHRLAFGLRAVLERRFVTEVIGTAVELQVADMHLQDAFACLVAFELVTFAGHVFFGFGRLTSTQIGSQLFAQETGAQNGAVIRHIAAILATAVQLEAWVQTAVLGIVSHRNDAHWSRNFSFQQFQILAIEFVDLMRRWGYF